MSLKLVYLSQECSGTCIPVSLSLVSSDEGSYERKRGMSSSMSSSSAITALESESLGRDLTRNLVIVGVVFRGCRVVKKNPLGTVDERFESSSNDDGGSSTVLQGFELGMPPPSLTGGHGFLCLLSHDILQGNVISTLFCLCAVRDTLHASWLWDLVTNLH